jgi:hypothetical protein
MKNWIKNINNQIYLFGIIIMSLPLLLVKDFKSLPGILTLCLWAFAIIIVTFIRLKLNKNEKTGNNQ